MSKHYAVLTQEQRGSQYGGYITKIIMVGLKDREEYVTYVDPGNFNAKNWQHITRHTEHGFILSNLRMKRGKKNIINADSDPVIVWEHPDKEELLAEVQWKWQEEDRRQARPTFDSLFDSE